MARFRSSLEFFERRIKRKSLERTVQVETLEDSKTRTLNPSRNRVVSPRDRKRGRHHRISHSTDTELSGAVERLGRFLTALF